MNRYDGTLEDWEVSARRAMQAEPTYFYYWDNLKTGLLIFTASWLVVELLTRRP